MKIALCAHCGAHFPPRKSKRFCSEKCRIRGWRSHTTPCTYCGSPADCTNQVPPPSARQLLQAQGITQWPFVEVPACHECISALHNRPIWTIDARRSFIKQWLKRRYRHYLNLPLWTKPDIDPLGTTLLQCFEESLIFAELVRRRILWAASPPQDAPPSPDAD